MPAVAERIQWTLDVVRNVGTLGLYGCVRRREVEGEFAPWLRAAGKDVHQRVVTGRTTTLGVPIEILPYHSAGSLADSATSNAWDVAVLADEPARAKEIAFAGAATEIEATYLVPAGSPLQKIEDVDSPGVRIALGAKSAYDLYLTRTVKHAQLVPIAGSPAAYKHFGLMD